MIQLYNPNNNNFTNNGDMTLIPSTCDIKMEINESWTLTLVHPIDAEGRWKSIVDSAVIKTPTPYGEQLYRITEVTKDDTSVNAIARPIFLDSVGDCFCIDVRPTNKTGQQALEDILSPNSKYSGSSDILTTNTAYYQMMNAMECIASDDSRSFLKRWGGEIIYNNFEIIINERCGGDYGVQLLYGKNIPSEGMSQTINVDDVVTRVIPKAFNGYYLPGDSPWVDSPIIGNYPTVVTKVIEYENIRLESDVEGDDTSGLIICPTMDDVYSALRTAAAEEFSKGNIDKPIVTIECDMVLLENTEEYKAFKNLERVGLGDTIYCRHDVLDIVTEARVVKLVYDGITDSVKEVTIGEVQPNYVDRIASTIKSVEKALTPSGGVVAERIEGFIDGALAQLRLQNSIAKRQDVHAILFEDTDPQSATFGAMALGTQGFQISHERTTDGRDWVWTTAATGEGIIADTIVAGILTDKLGRNYWNLNTGDFSLQGATISDSEIDGYATSTELQDAVDDLQAQIDGRQHSWFYSGAPSLTKPPVTLDPSNPGTGWTTDEEKRDHIGDVYYDTDTGYAYRFLYENDAFLWKRITDSDVTEALETARAAFNRATALYGICSTASGTATKVVDIPNFTLFTGANISVLFTNKNTASGTIYLQVGSDTSTRKAIRVNGQAFNNSIYGWSNNSLVDFVYNGTYWVMETNDQTEVFNRLTNGGEYQGLYMQNGDLYINGTYIKAGTIEGITLRGNDIIGNTINGGTINGTNINGSKFVNDISDSEQDKYLHIENAALTARRRYYIGASRTSGGELITNIDDGYTEVIYRYYSDGNILQDGRTTLFGNNIYISTSQDDIYGELGINFGIEPVADESDPDVGYNMPILDVDWGSNRYDYFPSFKPRESAKFGVGPYAGYVTNSGQYLVFWIPYYKSADGMNVDTITLPTTLTVRGTQGYLNSGSISGSTLEVASFDNRMGGLQVTLRQKNGNAFTNVTNNTPVSVVFNSGYLTATYKLYEN